MRNNRVRARARRLICTNVRRNESAEETHPLEDASTDAAIVSPRLRSSTV